MNTAVDNTVNFAAPARGPVDAVRTCLIKFFDFRGRASRSEFWWFFATVATLILLNALLPKSLTTEEFLLTAVVVQPPLWTVTVRRLHDINRTGWWIFPHAHLVALNAVAGLYLLHATGAVYWRGDQPVRMLLTCLFPSAALRKRCFMCLPSIPRLLSPGILSWHAFA